jgi:predicted site-specific integrase-resolvase
LDKLKKVKVCYARVSSVGQKDDLVRQKEVLTKTYPDYNLIEDIGSGINLTKRGLLKIIELAIDGKLEELVIVHKDRLARFGYELIEFLIKKYSNGKITIINKKEEVEPEEEMVKDVLQIMNVFVAKMNGRRKYNIKNNKNVKPKVKPKIK